MPGGGAGIGFLLKIAGGGGGFQDGRGREGVCGEFGEYFWGGRANFFFFRGRNVHQVYVLYLAGKNYTSMNLPP